MIRRATRPRMIDIMTKETEKIKTTEIFMAIMGITEITGITMKTAGKNKNKYKNIKFRRVYGGRMNFYGIESGF